MFESIEPQNLNLILGPSILITVVATTSTMAHCAARMRTEQTSLPESIIFRVDVTNAFELWIKEALFLCNKFYYIINDQECASNSLIFLFEGLESVDGQLLNGTSSYVTVE